MRTTLNGCGRVRETAFAVAMFIRILSNASTATAQDVAPVNHEKAPIAILIGCLKQESTRDKDEDAFRLSNVRPSNAMLAEPKAVGTAGSGSGSADATPTDSLPTYQITGLEPDLRRHVGEEVEVIVLADALDVAGAPQADIALQMQSIRTIAPACSMK